MKAISIFILFIAMFLIIQGYYTQITSCPPPKVEVKYIPWSLYEEQLSDENKVSRQFKSLFEDISSPWMQTKVS